MKNIIPFVILSSVITLGVFGGVFEGKVVLNTTKPNIKENKTSIKHELVETPIEKSVSPNTAKASKYFSFKEKEHELRSLKQPDEVQKFIKSLEREIDADNMIVKLNNGTASENEREIFGTYLDVRSESYKILIDMQFSELEREYL